MTQIIEAIADPALKSDREVRFTLLYEKVFPSVANFIRKRNGNLEDAKDVFHDALVVFYEKKSQQEVDISLTDEAYVFGIVKHLWIKKFNAGKSVVMGEIESLITIPDDLNFTVDGNSVITLLQSAGQKCMTLLQAFYYNNESLDTIASSFGFGSVRSATVQKFKCLEKLREEVKRKSIHYEDFVD
jgi:DNA-directed RNA polymerase specialized sigma24 family protein